MATSRVSVLILGAGGDLTKRLLLPGLASLLAKHEYDVQVIGSSMDERTDEQGQQLVRDSFAKVEDPSIADRYLRDTRYLKGDATKGEGLRTLLEGWEGIPGIYFALPPAVTAKVCAAL